MDFLSLFRIIASGIAGVTVAVLHETGADKHKTIAGQIAGVLQSAAAVAEAVHTTMTANAAPSPPQTAAAPEAGQTA